FAHQFVEMAKPHVDRDGLARLQQQFPVEIDRTVLTLRGDEYAGLGMIAVRERDSGIGRTARGCGDSGADLKRNSALGQKLDLLTASAKDEGIAALQPQDTLAFPCKARQQLADLVLRQGVVLRSLADIDPFRIA